MTIPANPVVAPRITGGPQAVSVPFDCTSTGALVTFANLAHAKSLHMQVQSTAIGGTSPTLDVKVQDSIDGGVTWNDLASMTFTQFIAANVVDALKDFTGVHGAMVRYYGTLGGSNKADAVNVDPTGTNNKVTWSSVATDGSKDGTITITHSIANDTAIAAYVPVKASNTLSVSTTGTTITVTLATGAGTKAAASPDPAGNNNKMTFTAKKAGVWANGATGGVSITYVAPTLPSQALAVSVSGGDISVSLATDAGTKDSFATTCTGNNNDLDWTAKDVAVTDLTITYLDPGKTNSPLSITGGPVDRPGGSHDIVVSLRTSPTGAILTTAADIAAALPGTEAGRIVSVANHSGNDGTGKVTAFTVQPLASVVAPAVTSTAAQVKTAIEALATAAALVDITNFAANDGTGTMAAVAKTNLAGGVDPVPSSTAGDVIALVNADGTAGGLVQGANFAANDGTGLMTVMPIATLVGGKVRVTGQIDMSIATS